MLKVNFALVIVLLKVVDMQMRTLCETVAKLNSSDDQIKKDIELNFEELKKDPKCIHVLMRRGFHNPAEHFLSLMMKNRLNFKDSLNMAMSKINYEMDHLQNKFRFGGGDILKATPATVWAQSLSNVFLQIKFSHLHDAPGCLELERETLEVHNDTLVFAGYCAIGDFPIKFNLTLDLLDSVDLEESTKEKLPSVGRLIVTLKKKNAPQYWKTLQKPEAPEIGSLKIWYDMKFRFIEELKEYEPIDDSEEITVESPESRRRRRRRKNDKDRLADDMVKGYDKNYF